MVISLDHTGCNGDYTSNACNGHIGCNILVDMAIVAVTNKMAVIAVIAVITVFAVKVIIV